MPGIFIHCRPDFESDCAAEIQFITSQAGIHGYCQTKPGLAYVCFHADATPALLDLIEQVDFRTVMFARQWFVFLDHLQNLPERDRVQPIDSSIRQIKTPLQSAVLEAPDSESGRSLSRFLKKFQQVLNPQQYCRSKKEKSRSGYRLHLCMIDSSEIYIGVAPESNSAAWSAGIPRLKLSRFAPSRSALKLEEAIIRFLTQEQRSRWLGNGKTAVDLGAAPGGWTWILSQHSVEVIAVDNGTLDRRMLETGRIHHIKSDAFTYKPEHPVDWMVCDVVDKPARVLQRLGLWFNQNWCRRAIFNIKLPMKQRFAYIEKCLDEWVEGIDTFTPETRIFGKQLYHDRQEITLFVDR